MENKLRIAIVISHPIQHFCPQYVSFSENADIDLKVFFGSMLGYKQYSDPNFKKEVSWDNLNLEKFQHQFLNGDQVLMPDRLLDADCLGNALSTFKPQLVIVYGYYQQLQKRAYYWAKKNKVIIAYISDTEMRHRRSRFTQVLKYFFLYYYFSGINLFLSVGDANEFFYRKHGVQKKKIVRMHFPIDVKQYEKEYANKNALRKIVRDQYQITDEEIVLSVVGKLVTWKNQDHLINALELLEQKGLFFRLFIIGSGEMQESWEKKAKTLKKSKAHFTGFVSINLLPSYYAATDIYVHPASIEPHSIAISEALYMGCPIIVSSTCGSYGVNDDVQEGKNGFVYEFGNILGLCNTIERLSIDKHLRLAFGEYSHQIAVTFQHQAHYGIISDISERMSSLKYS
jgi:glycosyltransferase involved in cell wall biosynthesis